MRIAAFAVTLALAATAWAQDATPPASEPAAAASEATPAAQPKAAPTPRQVRYVNDKGETLVCKAVSGATGTRLKGRGKLICGTQSEWDDSDSEINQLFDNMIRTNTPSPRG